MYVIMNKHPLLYTLCYSLFIANYEQFNLIFVNKPILLSTFAKITFISKGFALKLVTNVTCSRN